MALDMMYNRVDKATLSNYEEYVIRHMHFEWNIDFTSKELNGKANLKVEVLSDKSNQMHFDSSKLNIKECSINGKSSTYAVAGAHQVLGEKLSLQIPENVRLTKGEFLDVQVVYSAGSTASAMQWLDAACTKGGQHPYLFTQCQAIHARSMFPCQDTPAVKCTFSAVVTAPAWCTVLMSGLEDSTVTNRSAGVFGFHQPIPVPSYLVALAAGNLASKDISDRVRVWSEPEMVEAVAHEFSETEDFLRAAESLVGPYQWTRYDVLCLPPSFPFGGMENPCLTFATPTLLAGDRSLADVIAHEIAHSWTGNLVTNITWEHFWLNEGWTVWLERKIVSRTHGSIEIGKLSATSGWKSLVDSVNGFGKDHEFTQLVREPSDQDPDDAFSTVPYEKGFNLLNYLETIIGTPKFEAFAKSYVERFQRAHASTGEFRDYFVDFVDKNAPEHKKAIDALDWVKIFCTPGMPSHPDPDFSTTLADVALSFAKSVVDATDEDLVSGSFTYVDLKHWNTAQKNILLDTLILSGPISESKLKSLDLQYHFTETQNSEVRFRWQSLCLQTGVEWIVPHVVDFLVSQGRMKFVRPLYRALNGCSKVNGSKIAVATFLKHSDSYHPIARKMIAVDLGVNLSVTANKISMGCPHCEGGVFCGVCKPV